MNAPPTILLIEDHPADLDLTCRALRMVGWDGHVEIARDGEEALAWLPRWDAGWSRPNLILLDLKLPRVDGLEVLRQYKEHPEHRAIPVIVLSTSAATADVSAAYRAGANSYLVKPVDFDEFVARIAVIREYWFVVNHAWR